MSFGQTLREAREARGLTPEKIAADTHILVQIINDMENENFKRIPAPIYGRGFIRLFAEEVGLDPQPLIQEYMDIINGRRPPLMQMPPIIPRPETPTPPKAETAVPPSVIDDIPPAVEVPPLVRPFSAPEVPAPPAEHQADTIPPHIWDPDPIQPHVVPPPTQMPIPEPDPEPAPVAVPEPKPAPEPQPVQVPIPEPEPIPVVTPPPTPASPQIPVVPPVSPEVEGLPLFGRPPQPAAQPAAGGLPPQVDTESILPSSYDEEGPGIGQRIGKSFKDSINTASSFIVQRAQSIPRRTWRISLVSVVALLVLALMVFGCIKLYQATARPAVDPCANGVCEVDLTKKPAPAKPQPQPATATPNKTSTTAAKPSAPKPAAKPGKLRTTGQKVPSLYMD